MAKRIKKPLVKPEIRRQWLRRHDEDGESPPQIAQTDGFDVRTVRKQIELARQERERREARSMVLRQAVEQHYKDLVDFAQKLDLELKREAPRVAALKDDPMWPALREHMPKSPIWKNVGRWESLRDEISNLEDSLNKQFTDSVGADAPLEFKVKPDDAGLDLAGIASALAFNFKAKAKGESGIDDQIGFKTDEPDEETTSIRLGAYAIGRVPNNMVTEVEQFVTGLLTETIAWEEHRTLSRLFTELKRMQQALHEELLIITLRRIVPGRCRYCPI